VSFLIPATAISRRRVLDFPGEVGLLSTRTFSPEVSHPVVQPEFEHQTPSSAKRPGLGILQPDVTYTGAPIKPLQKGLPKQTESLCPECTKIIRADIFADAGKVVMEKTCAEHGQFRDIIFSDVELYLKMEEWNFGDNLGLSNPAGRRRQDVPG
jgi:hypothetical protein